MSDKELGVVVKGKDEVSGPFAKVKKSLNGIGDSAGGLKGKLAALGGAFKTMGKVALVGIAGIAAGLLAAFPSMLELGTKLEQMAAKAKTVFGDQLGVVEKWAATSANAMGLTSRQAVGLAANFADLLVPMGFTREQAAGMSTDVVGLSGALAQWSGGTRTATEVSEILAKAMLGEREGLKELGISITEADVKARLLADGNDKLTGSALAQAKAQATQALIFEKSKDAQAAFATGSDTLIGKQALMGAKVEELKEKIAVGLTPVFHTVVSFVTDKFIPAVEDIAAGIGDWFEENKELVKQLTDFAGIVLKAVVDGIGFVIGKAGEFISWIVNNKTIMDGLRTTVDLIATAFTLARDALGFVITKISEWVTGITNNKSVMDSLRTVAEHIGNAFNIGADAVGFMITKLAELAGWVRDNLNTLRDLARFLPGVSNALAFQDAAEGRASGGPVTRGRPYLIGERGPELMVPRTSGRIIPNGGSGGLSIAAGAIVISGASGDPRAIAREVMQELKREANRQRMSLTASSAF